MDPPLRALHPGERVLLWIFVVACYLKDSLAPSLAPVASGLGLGP